MVGKHLDSSTLGKYFVPVEAAGLSEYTLKNYRSALNTLLEILTEKNGTPINLKWLLGHPEKTIAALRTRYTNIKTQKSMISPILSIFKYNPSLFDQGSFVQECKDAYYEAYKEADQQCKSFYDSLDMSAREEAGWVPWRDIVQREAELRNSSSYASLDHLLLAMYVLLSDPGSNGGPLRADFGAVRLCQRDLPLESDENFLNLSQGKLVLKQYKTSRHYGHLIREVPRTLLDIIKRSLELHPRDYLFVDSVKQLPYVRNSYCRQANRTFQYLFGKPLTIRLVRQAYVSSLDFSSLTPHSLREIGKSMGHSQNMQQGYRRRFQKTKPEAPPEPSQPPAATQLSWRRKKGPTVTVNKVSGNKSREGARV